MAGLLVKGTAAITIDARELEAKLSFTPDADGPGWDYDAIAKAAADKQLKPPPSRETVDEFLKKASRAKEAFEIVLSSGTPPEEPRGEELTWEALPVPADVADFLDAALKAAGPPEIFRVKTEKIKREKTVKKPNKLPFLPPKEELVVVWETRETKEPVTADVALRDKKYALRDNKLGTIEPAKPGKPGKSVLGKAIPPAQSAEGNCFFGAGIARNKNEIFAQYSGILRIGSNWADIVPLAKPEWSVTKGADGMTLFFKFEAGDSRFANPDGKDVLAKAREMGASETDLISAGSIDREIQNSIASGEAIFAFPIFAAQEAAAKVILSEDKLKAELFLRKGVAGAQALEMRAISQAIKDSKVKGFDAEKLKADINAFMQGKDIVLKNYVLAEGKESTRGKDKEIKVLVEYIGEEEKNAILDKLTRSPHWQAQLDKDRFLPLSEVGNIAMVEKGVKIAQVLDPAPGEQGKDIFGNVLAALPGNDPDIKLYKGLHLKGQDIFTERAGILLVHKGERLFRAQVAEYSDAKVIVQVSSDNMEATLELVKETGAGKPLNSAMISAALKEAGVVKGIDRQALEEAYREAMTKGSASPRVAAAGKPPVAGGGTSVQWLVDFHKPASAVTIEEDGQANYKKQQRFVSVSKGMVLAELDTYGEEGKNGFDVKGNELAAEQGTSLTLEHDDSIQETPVEGGVRLVALQSGELMFKDNRFTIISIHVVQGDVGLATGNIKFAGEIQISGKVSAGFAVMGGRDVLIKECAESSLVSAGGKVHIGQGIIGRGKGVVRARATIDAAFAEQATLMAVDNIRVKNGSVLCNIKTNGKLIIAGEKGRLVGGVCKARQGVDAANVGSEQGNRTEISFGQDYLVKDQIETTEREIEKVKNRLEEVETEIKRVANMKAALEEARAEKVKCLKQLDALSLAVFNLREKFEEHHESEIRIRGNVYPGVVMESHGRYYEVQQKRSRIIFYFDRETGRIQEKPLT